MKRGEAALAATAFARSRQLAGRGAVAEDAHFWQGVAFARAGNARKAIPVLRSFLASYPRSARAGEASARLGWLLIEAGDAAAAEPLFRAASDDPVPSVRNSARAGLERVRPR